MSNTVTIEGTITPSSFLPRGERRTVVRSSYIDKLIAGGFVEIVGVEPEPADEVDEASVDESDTAITYTFDDGEVVTLRKDPETGLILPPGRNEAVLVWQVFLDHAGVAYADDDSRTELIKRYDASNG